MLKLLTATSASILLAAPAIAAVDPKVAAQCKDARDFVGCVKAFSTPAAVATEDGLEGLRNAMKQVAARLNAGTSFRDSTLTFQPLVDALALVEHEKSGSLAVEKATMASRLFNVMQNAWDLQITGKNHEWSKYSGGAGVWSCAATTQIVNRFNDVYGSSVINLGVTKKGWLNLDVCMIPIGQMPLDYMYPVVIRVLNEGAISPAEIASREVQAKEEATKRQRDKELCEMGPWNRRLEEDPKLKAWAKANPSAAKTEMGRFKAKEGNKVSCTSLVFNYAPMSPSVKACADVKPPQWDTEMCSKYPDAGKASGCCK